MTILSEEEKFRREMDIIFRTLRFLHEELGRGKNNGFEQEVGFAKAPYGGELSIKRINERVKNLLAVDMPYVKDALSKVNIQAVAQANNINEIVRQIKKILIEEAEEKNHIQQEVILADRVSQIIAKMNELTQKDISGFNYEEFATLLEEGTKISHKLLDLDADTLKEQAQIKITEDQIDRIVKLLRQE